MIKLLAAIENIHRLAILEYCQPVNIKQIQVLFIYLDYI